GIVETSPAEGNPLPRPVHSDLNTYCWRAHGKFVRCLKYRKHLQFFRHGFSSCVKPALGLLARVAATAGRLSNWHSRPDGRIIRSGNRSDVTGYCSRLMEFWPGADDGIIFAPSVRGEGVRGLP